MRGRVCRRIGFRAGVGYAGDVAKLSVVLDALRAARHSLVGRTAGAHVRSARNIDSDKVLRECVRLPEPPDSLRRISGVRA